MAQIGAVIWDLNGTLDNSEEIRMRSVVAALADMGHDFDHSHYPEIMRRAGFEVPTRYIASIYGFLEADSFAKNWEVIFNSMYERELSLRSGVSESLNLLQAQGVRLGVASNSHREFVRDALDRLGVSGRFDTVVTRDDVKELKPDPEMLVLAAGNLGVETNRCVMVGDSHSDVEAARAAGMRAVYVPGVGERKH